MKPIFSISALLATALTVSLAYAATITKGHLDLDIDYSGGANGTMTMDWKTGSGMSAGTPANNDDYPIAGNPISVPLATALTVPSSSTWSCLGTAGSTVYVLPQSQNMNWPWPGSSTEDIGSGMFVNNKIQFELVSVVAAPANGRFIMYTTGSFGTPTFLLNSTSGSCNKMVWPNGGLTTNTHAHYNWAFSAPGTYTLRFKATGTLTAANGGGTKTTGNVDVTFIVQ